MSKSISTHVLNTSIGKAAIGVPVTLEQQKGAGFTLLGKGVTNADGRLTDLLKTPLERATYRLTFDTTTYFKSLQLKCFYPQVQVTFEVSDETQHHHVPLLLNPFGYSTYRGT